MTTPLCHRMLATLPATWFDGQRDGGAYFPECTYSTPEQCLCRGSDCALWVPQAGEDVSEPLFTESGTRWNDTLPDTGNGWCADNLRRQPWKDPASGGEK